ncbi:low affinity immunoglobulin gamma Fc region receptor II-like [Centroberyx affinis]|uniref:low affinity immunoglobulin gamma Fc region receptor II-like n=1 Tax=Centroberyx affinis TaxID=166261 RepID=UPI003A5BC147
MEITALCIVVASLRVSPEKSQFFKYESVSLSCEGRGNSSGWRVWRNTSTRINDEWGRRNESHCVITDLFPSDSGVYWCESGSGECSNAVNITVTAGPVILESPVLPVMEGDAVTLRCRNQTTPSNLTAGFYKDGFLIRTDSTGEITLNSISKSDEGFYKCNISGVGESPESWLAVRALHPGPSHFLIVRILLPVAGVCLMMAFLLLLLLLLFWRKRKGGAAADVSYTDVVITQEAQPRIERDTAAPSVYSTVKLPTT